MEREVGLSEQAESDVGNDGRARVRAAPEPSKDEKDERVHPEDALDDVSCGGVAEKSSRWGRCGQTRSEIEMRT